MSIAPFCSQAPGALERYSSAMPAAIPSPAIGTRFGRLSFVSDAAPIAGRRLWTMRCDCGSHLAVKPGQLACGHVRSCGCLRKEAMAVGGRVKDLTGDTFGRLTVLSLISKTGGARWSCLCSCGSLCEASSQSLVAGDAQSCGCLRLERVRLDLAGRTFGRLTAVEPVASSRYGRTWRCVCSCGGESRVLASLLAAGRIISCGCAIADKPGLSSPIARSHAAANNNRRRARKVAAGGTFTAAQVDALYAAQRGRCACCGAKLNGVFHRDHRTALANGGTNDISNIELLCGPCNLSKGAKDEIAWAAENGRLL